MPCNRATLLAGGVLLVAAVRAPADAQRRPVRAERQDLTALTLSELAELEVTSVSKRPEKVTQVPAAVFVITGEDLRRAGIRTLPEALRLAPGVQVARINANQWAVGIRGFASRLSRSLLVLMDGRSVYSPLFAGTYWEVQDTLLEDIDRIEVIRGPGGAVWGSNAVAGVINIITKSAAETLGAYARAGAGTEERLFGSSRYGFAAGAASARVYGKYAERDAQLPPPGVLAFDRWNLAQGGFRTDLSPGAGKSLTLTGDVYSGRLGQRVTYGLYTPPYTVTDSRRAHVSGGNVLARGSHELADGGSLVAQAFWDRTTRSEANFSEARSTFDVEVRHTTRLPLSQELIWGVGYRVSTGRGRAVETVVFAPATRRDTIFNIFFQDQLPLVARRLTLVAGAKLEHNDYSGWEAQPNVRLLYTPSPTHTAWAAVSRAVRTPTRIDQDLSLTVLASPNGPTFFRVLGTDDFEAEKVVACEAGWRAQPSPRFWVDTAVFYNRHTDLLSFEPGAPFREGAFTILPYQESNGIVANAFGGEVAAEVALRPSWHLQAAYSYLQMDVHPRPGSADTTSSAAEGASPRHQVSLLSASSLWEGIDLDVRLRFVDQLPSQGVSAYTTADVRLSWKPHPAIELAVAGQNLFQPSHAEHGAPATRVSIQRGVFGEAVLRW